MDFHYISRVSVQNRNWASGWSTNNSGTQTCHPLYPAAYSSFCFGSQTLKELLELKESSRFPRKRQIGQGILVPSLENRAPSPGTTMGLCGGRRGAKKMEHLRRGSNPQSLDCDIVEVQRVTITPRRPREGRFVATIQILGGCLPTPQ